MENKKSKRIFNYTKANELINNKGLRKDYVAEKCRVTASTIRECLRGTRSPSMAVVALMAIALECEESELLSEDESHAA